MAARPDSLSQIYNTRLGSVGSTCFSLPGIAEQRRLRNGGRGEDRQHGKAPEQHRGSKNRVQPKGKQCGGKSGAKPRYRQRAAERSKLLMLMEYGGAAGSPTLQGRSGPA
ncbi:MAG: hypothetical protein F4X50_07720 [Synechococcus sp. SB0662_bin_14]|nr:hypothetical protein [Synechococcus sp. SB0662_bin_14]